MIDVEEIDSTVYCNLRCFSCKNFLSVSPILLDTSGNNICGRCKSDSKRDLLGRNTFYEKVARHFIFPCRFVEEGCTVRRSFDKLLAHEEVCPFLIVKCQVTKCLWHGTLTELKMHYNKCHQDLVINNDCVQEISQSSGYFMLSVDGFYFLIEWSYHECMFKMKIRNLDLMDLEEDIPFVYILSTSELEKLAQVSLTLSENVITSEYEFIKKSSSATSVLFCINATVSKSSIDKKIAENLKKIKCSHCSLQMVPPILTCPEGHITCVDCSGSGYAYCILCDSDDDVIFRRVPELEYIALTSEYTCRWQCCNDIFSVRKIQAHQQVCPKRMYDCLYCTQWHGLRNEVIPHNIICKSECPMAVGTELTFMGTEIDQVDAERSLLAHNERFWIFVDRNNTYTDIGFCNCGPPSLFGWFRYEVDLQHISDLNFPFNRTYSVYSKICNRHSIEVPVSDIEKFGGPEFFKIVVKIILLEGSERTSNVLVYLNKYLRSIGSRAGR